MKTFTTFFIAALVIVLFLLNSSNKKNDKTLNDRAIVEQVTIKETPSIKMIFVGDIMMDRGVKRSIDKNFSGDYEALFINTSYLNEADITFANLEGSVAYGGRNVGSIYSFHMDPISLKSLKKTGVDIVSFANNHVGDWSTVAFDESLEHLRSNGILYSGAGKDYEEATGPTIIDIRGIKFGFLATTDVGPDWLKATEEKPGILLASDPNLAGIISKAKKQVDVLIVSFHFGNEYSPTNSRQKSLAYMSIDNGADIVIGHHPHVMQKVEKYKDKPIFYSLGNFIFDQKFSRDEYSLHTMRGMVAFVEFDPETKELTYELKVSPLSKDFIPQDLVPFEEGMLVTKTFTP